MSFIVNSLQIKRFLLVFLILLGVSNSLLASDKILGVDLDSLLGENNIILKTYKWGDRTFNSYDTAYVAGTGTYFNARVKNDNWFDLYSLSFPNGTKINIASDMMVHVGASIGYRAVSIGYMVDVQNAFRKNTPTRNRSIFSFSASRVVFTAFYYRNNSTGTIFNYGNHQDLGNNKKIRFDGVDAESYGLEVEYIFNYKKYSYAAAYNYSRIQKKSAGSMIVGLKVQRNNYDFDFTSLPLSFDKYIPSENKNLKFDYIDYGLMFGYGYNWALGKHWLLGATAVPSIGWKHTSISSSVGSQNIFSLNGSVKLAAVYNVNRYFVGFLGQLSTNWFSGSAYSLFDMIGTMNLSVGIRF